MSLKDKIYESRFALIVAIASGFFVSFEQTIWLVPFVVSLYVVFRYNKFIRNQALIIVYPILMFLCWFTSGGSLVLFTYLNRQFGNESSILSDKLGQIIMGLSGAMIVLLLTKVFFKIQLNLKDFKWLLIFIPFPYILGLLPDKEFGNSVFLFYFVFNLVLILVLENIFRNSKKQYLHQVPQKT